MSVDSIKEIVIERCKEDANGSWELWWAVRAEFSQLDRPQARRDFVTAIEQLIGSGRIISAKYIEGGTFEPTIFVRERLDHEVQQADTPNGNEFYWFCFVK